MFKTLKTPRKVRQKRALIPNGIFETLESRQLMSTTYYVATNGNDSNAGTSAAPFATLQSAVQHLQAGDTLDVRAGTYKGFIVGWDGVNQGVYSQINGTAGDPITIQADPAAAPGSVIINSRNSKTPDGIDLEPGDTGCNYININGFTITNDGSISNYGIKVAQSDHVNITNLTVHGMGETGIFTSFSSLGTIANNLSYSNGEHGIYASNSPQNEVITNNVLHDNASGGIEVNADASQGGLGTAGGLTISNNVIYNNGANGGGALNMDGLQNSTIQNNLLYNNHSSGLVLYDGDASQGSTGNVVVNNTIVQAAGARQALNDNTNSGGNTFFNNIFLGNMLADSSSTPAAFSHNILLSGFTTDGGFTFAGSTTTTAAALFTNPGSNDYTLKSGSVAINAGMSSLNGKAAPTTDLVGNARPNGGAFDDGAYEVSGGTQPPPSDTTAPTASLSDSNVTAAGGTTYSFTVTYNDDVAVNVATVDNSDVKVTGPNGFSQLATKVSIDNNSNGTPRTVTYQINVPGGTWDSADNGTYTVAMQSGQVADTSNNTVASGNLGSFNVNISSTPPADTTPPTASLTASNVTTGGGTNYQFNVAYTDNVGINVATVDSSDVLVSGPNGFSQMATLVSLNNYTNGSPRVATYQITAPGGAWDNADNGTYSVALKSGQVADTSGNTAAAANLGTFSVSVASSAPPAGDTTPPTAYLSAPNVVSSGAKSYSFTVTYSDNVGIDTSTIGSNDLLVTGPKGFSQMATMVSVVTNSDGSVSATYKFTPPGGSWNRADNGRYDITIQTGAVLDKSGNALAAGFLDEFSSRI